MEQKPVTAQVKSQQTIRSFIRNIGLPSSPIIGKRPIPSGAAIGSLGATGELIFSPPFNFN